MSWTLSNLTKFSPSSSPLSPQYPHVTSDTAHHLSPLLSIHPLSLLSTRYPSFAAFSSLQCHFLITSSFISTLRTSFCCAFPLTRRAALFGHSHRQCPALPHPQHFISCCASLLMEHAAFLSSSHPITLLFNALHLLLHNPPPCSLSAILSSCWQWRAMCPNQLHLRHLLSPLYPLNVSNCCCVRDMVLCP